MILKTAKNIFYTRNVATMKQIPMFSGMSLFHGFELAFQRPVQCFEATE